MSDGRVVGNLERIEAHDDLAVLIRKCGRVKRGDANDKIVLIARRLLDQVQAALNLIHRELYLRNVHLRARSRSIWLSTCLFRSDCMSAVTREGIDDFV